MWRPAFPLIGLILAGCGASTSTGAGQGTPSTAATAAPTAAPVTAAMLIAVADRVFLRTPMSGAEYGECDSASDFSACPVTPRLLGRLEQHPISGGVGGAAPFCRCQNFWPTQSITATPAAGGGVAHVTIFGSVVIDLVMTVVNGTLLVDDTLCSGRGAATSIFANPVVPCAPLRSS